MPAELAERLSKSGAIPTTPRPKNAPPGEDLDGWSESLVGWIPEESRIAAVPAESTVQSRSTLVLVAVIAAVVVGGGGIAAAVMFSGDDAPDPVATATEDQPGQPAPTVAAPVEPPSDAPPMSDHEPEILLDEDDLVLDGAGADADEPEPAEASATSKAKKKAPAKKARDVGEPASGPVVQLSASTVRREIAQNMFHIHRCYDSALKRDPTLEGRYSVTITIGTNGRVSRAVIDRDTLRHPGVASCVKRKLKEWRFPLHGRLSEPTEVSFPVTFKR